MRARYKSWAKPYLDSHQEVQILPESYPLIKDIELEIGSGKGSFIVKKALNNPDIQYIGLEKNVSCAGDMAKKIVASELTNVKMIFDFAEKVLPLIKDKSINVIYLNFSDPWPKKRHHKRRLTTDGFLKEYFRVLKDDGEIIFKTDNEDLFLFSSELFPLANFEIVYTTSNYQELEPGDEMTEYEENFRKEGKPIYRLKARKKK